MKSKYEAYRNAIKKAVDFQLQFQLPDGGYIWEGYAVDAYHKQAYSWALQGHFDEAHRLLNWVRDNRLQADGQLKEYNGDIYKHSWMCHGAHRLGRFDVSYPIMSFILTCQAPCGGFPHFAGDKLVRALSTAWTGVTALYLGNIDAATKAAKCCISMLEQQPDENRYYYQMTLDGKLATEKEFPNAEFIDATKLKQSYWEVGLSMLLMDRMYQVTKDPAYLEYARRYFEFLLRCREDNFSYWGSGKGALAAAIYYTFTDDKRALDAAYKFCDFVVETQKENGGFQYEDEPDELLIYVDHAACFSVWVLESLSYIQGKLGIV
ncbi:MAG TPA: hypothetical protein GXX14_00520 [Clostridiaceae bacterium]|nr:hypothetical protein [Clostridiaceae bacterium]